MLPHKVLNICIKTQFFHAFLSLVEPCISENKLSVMFVQNDFTGVPDLRWSMLYNKVRSTSDFSLRQKYGII